MAAAVGELLQRRLVPVDNDTSTLKITSQPASNILSTFSLQCIPSAMNTQPIDQVFSISNYKLGTFSAFVCMR